MIYGAEANIIDHEIKDHLIKIQVDCNEAVILAHQDQVYEKDGRVHIMTIQEDGSYYSLKDDKTYESLEGFENKKEDILEQTGILNE